MSINVYDDDICIGDSWQVSKWDFQNILEYIAVEFPENPVIVNRSLFSLKMEWTVHNFLYALGIQRERTGSVDFNYPNRWEWAYIIFGLLVYIFVK